MAQSVAFAGNAPRALTVGFAANVLDTDAWALRRSFSAHDGVVGWGAISPDGTRGFTIGNDNVLRVWGTDDGVEIAHASVDAGASSAQTLGVFGALAPDGAVAVVNPLSGAVQVLAPGTLATRWTGSAPLPVESVMFTPDGGTLIVGTVDQFLRFKAGDGTSLAPLMIPGSDGHGTLSGDGQVFATTGPVFQVQTLRYPDGAPTMSPVTTPGLSGVALSHDGSILAFTTYDGVSLVQTNDGTPIRMLPGSAGYSIAFSGDDTYVAAAGAMLIVWRRSDGNVMFNSGTTLGGAILSPARPVLATYHDDQLTVAVWDFEQGQILRTLNDATPNSYDILGFSAAGRLSLGIEAVTWRALLYDLAQPQPVSNVAYTSATQAPDWLQGRAWLTGDEKYLVGAGDSSNHGTVRIWDTATGTVVRTLAGHENGWTTLALDDANRRIATAGYDPTTPGGPDRMATIKLWDRESGALLQTFVGHTDDIVQVAFSPDGRQLLSGGQDGLVRLWSIADGSVVRDFAGPTDRLTIRTWYGLGVSFSPSGRLVASAGNDSTVRDGATVVNVWSTDSGSLVRHLQVRGDIETGYFANWSADGRAIVGTGVGGLYVWCVDGLDGAAPSP